MQDLQDIYNRVRDTRSKIKDLRAQYKDALTAVPDYQSVKEKLQGHRLRKLQIENGTKKQMAADFDRMEQLKKSLVDDNQMLSDISMTKLMKGETVEVVDPDNNSYEPVFVVKFKRKK